MAAQPRYLDAALRDVTTADGPTQVRKRTQKELQPAETHTEHVIRATCSLFTGFYLDLDRI